MADQAARADRRPSIDPRRADASSFQIGYTGAVIGKVNLEFAS